MCRNQAGIARRKQSYLKRPGHGFARIVPTRPVAIVAGCHNPVADPVTAATVPIPTVTAAGLVVITRAVQAELLQEDVNRLDGLLGR